MTVKTDHIAYSSPSAATKKTMKIWVDGLEGRIWPDEHTARWYGCTHVKCKCGNVISKRYTACDDCKEKNRIKKYESMPFKGYENDEAYFSETCSEYFFSDEDITEFCYNENINPAELDLVYCEPTYAREIEEYGIDYLPEDTMLEDISPKLQDKINELNEYIAKEKIILSWSPGEYRTEFEE